MPVVKAADIEDDGKVRTLFLMGELKDRPNSLINTWDEKGYEKEKGTSMITLIDESGVKSIAHVVSNAGRTVDLYVHPYFRDQAPNREDVVGKAATMDDIADSLDMGRSTRNYIVGAIIGMALYAGLIGPMISAVLK